MFRSSRRPVVFPQAEHARFAAAIAAAWGNDDFTRPGLPFDAFVRGVALHDRGYGELDDDGIGEVSAERWIEIQRRGFEPRAKDAVVDLVVALHVHRLVASKPRTPVEAGALPAMTAALPSLLETAGVSEDTAAAADSITALCDRISFAFCVEAPKSSSSTVVAGHGTGAVEITYAVDGEGGIRVSPWPFGVSFLTGVVTGFAAAGYPSALEAVPVVYRVERGTY